MARTPAMVRAIAAGMALVSSYRRHGHLAATLDPLGVKPEGDSAAAKTLAAALIQQHELRAKLEAQVAAVAAKEVMFEERSRQLQERLKNFART